MYNTNTELLRINLTEITTSKVIKANGGITTTGTNVLEFGVGATKEVNAGKIGYGTFDEPSSLKSLNIIGAGTSSRYVRIWDFLSINAPATASYNLQVGGTANITGALTCGSLTSSGTANFSTVNISSVLQLGASPGSSGQYLMSNGANTAPSWSQVVTSGYAPLSGATFTGLVTANTGITIVGGSLTVSSSSGTSGQYLKSNGANIAPSWSSITKETILLSNVENTTDLNKPVSTATQAALDLKANLASPTFTGLLSAGSLSAGSLSVSSISNGEIVSNSIKCTGNNVLEFGVAVVGKQTDAGKIGYGTFDDQSSLKSLNIVGAGLATGGSRCVRIWECLSINTPATTSYNLQVGGTGNFTGVLTAPTAAAGTNTIQVATTAFVTSAISSKANLASPAFTGNVTGITATMVGLGNVNDTTDANKPVSTATRAALDLKANLSGAAFTGAITCSSTITATGQITAASFNATSDYRIKQNVEPITDTIDNLKPVKYFNKQSKTEDMGFIAHEIQEEFPFLVSGEKDAKDMQSLNYLGLIALLTKELQELKSTVKSLQTKIDILESK